MRLWKYKSLKQEQPFCGKPHDQTFLQIFISKISRSLHLCVAGNYAFIFLCSFRCQIFNFIPFIEPLLLIASYYQVRIYVLWIGVPLSIYLNMCCVFITIILFICNRIELSKIKAKCLYPKLSVSVTTLCNKFCASP